MAFEYILIVHVFNIKKYRYIEYTLNNHKSKQEIVYNNLISIILNVKTILYITLEKLWQK